MRFHLKKEVLNKIEKLQMLTMCLFSLTFCFRTDLNHFFLITSLFFSLFLFSRDLLIRNHKAIIALILVYIIAAFSVSYSTNYKEGMFVLEKQLTLLLLPLIFGSSLRLDHHKLRPIVASFVISLFFVCIYLLLIFLNKFLIQSVISFQEFLTTQIHHEFSSPLKLHATYLSIYVCFSIVCSLYVLLYEKTIFKIISVLFLVIFLLSLVLLSSRIIFVAFGIITFIVLPFFLKKKPLVIYGVILLGLTLILLYTVNSFSALKERFKTDTFRELNIKQDGRFFIMKDISGSNDATRAERWKCSVELIKERPVFGYGTGDEKKKLSEKYVKYNLTNSLINNFDAHNQYLAYMIKSGIFGLIAYLILLGYSLFISLKELNFIHICFLLIIMTASLTENVLESNKGILFFAFFNTLLVFSSKSLISKN